MYAYYLTLVIAEDDSAICNSYKVEDPNSNLVLVISNALETDVKFFSVASSDFS